MMQARAWPSMAEVDRVGTGRDYVAYTSTGNSTIDIHLPDKP
jgi:hypothetical protein